MRTSIPGFESISRGRVAAGLDSAVLSGLPQRAWRIIRRYPVIPVAIVILLAVIATFAPFRLTETPVGVRTGRGQDTSCVGRRRQIGVSSWRRPYRPGHTEPRNPRLAHIADGGGNRAERRRRCRHQHGYPRRPVRGVLGRVHHAARRSDLRGAFPVVALVVATVFGPSLGLVLILLSVFSWPGFARQTRGLTLQLKTTDYVSMARIAGSSTMRISYRHILPA